MTIKSKIANVILWAAYLTTLAASMGHVAWAFSRLEFEGSQWVGWLAAVSIDLGLAAWPTRFNSDGGHSAAYAGCGRA